MIYKPFYMENQQHISTIEMEAFLQRRLGEKEAAEVIDYINIEIDKRVEERIGEVRNEAALWRTHLKDDFATKEDGEVLRTKLVKRVSSVEGTIILWGFVFWITIILAFYIITRFVS